MVDCPLCGMPIQTGDAFNEVGKYKVHTVCNIAAINVVVDEMIRERKKSQDRLS